MKGYFRSAFLTVSIILAVFGGAFTACTEVDDTLGLDFIPDNQNMKVKMDTISDLFDTYYTFKDSIPTSFMQTIYIGNYTDQQFGLTTTGGLFHFLPGSFTNDDYFGYNPQMDSIRLSLYVSAVYGNHDIEQTFNIYEINTRLPLDTLYYASFPIETVVDFNDPIFTFTMEGAAVGYHNKWLVPTAKGEALLQRFLDTEESVYETGDSVFHKLFNPWYIAPASDSPKDAAIYQITLGDPTGYYGTDSYFTLFTHNYQEDDPAERRDTLLTNFYFDDSDVYSSEQNVSLFTVKHDYTNSAINPALFSDTTSTSATQPVIYIQGLQGVVGYIKIKEQILDVLESYKTIGTEVYSDLMINHARLIMPLTQKSVDNYNNAPGRMGMYYDFVGATPNYMPDYNYVYELNYQVKLNYNGYINRTHGHYEMDITSYIKRLVYYPDETPRTIWLAPDYSLLYDVSHVALNGTGAAEPIELEIAYTLIK